MSFDPWAGLFPLSVFGLIWALDRFSLTTPAQAQTVYAVTGSLFVAAMVLWGIVLWPTFGTWLILPVLTAGRHRGHQSRPVRLFSARTGALFRRDDGSLTRAVLLL